MHTCLCVPHMCTCTGPSRVGDPGFFCRPGDKELILSGSGLWGSGLPLSCSAFPLLLTCSTSVSDSFSLEVGKGKFRNALGSQLSQIKPAAGP